MKISRVQAEALISKIRHANADDEIASNVAKLVELYNIACEDYKSNKALLAIIESFCSRILQSKSAPPEAMRNIAKNIHFDDIGPNKSCFYLDKEKFGQEVLSNQLSNTDITSNFNTKQALEYIFSDSYFIDARRAFIDFLLTELYPEISLDETPQDWDIRLCHVLSALNSFIVRASHSQYADALKLIKDCQDSLINTFTDVQIAKNFTIDSALSLIDAGMSELGSHFLEYSIFGTATAYKKRKEILGYSLTEHEARLFEKLRSHEDDAYKFFDYLGNYRNNEDIAMLNFIITTNRKVWLLVTQSEDDEPLYFMAASSMTLNDFLVLWKSGGFQRRLTPSQLEDIVVKRTELSLMNPDESLGWIHIANKSGINLPKMSLPNPIEPKTLGMWMHRNPSCVNTLTSDNGLGIFGEELVAEAIVLLIQQLDEVEKSTMICSLPKAFATKNRKLAKHILSHEISL